MATRPGRFPYWVLIFLPIVVIYIVSMNSGGLKSASHETAAKAQNATRLASDENDSIELRQSRASMILERLVKTHPSPKINTELKGMIERHEVFLNFEESMLESSHAFATIQFIKTPTHGIILTLIVSANGLFDQAISDHFKQLVIYHEYIHVEQLRDGRIPQHQLYARRIDVPVGTSEMRAIFHMESEAYTEECKLAVSLKWEHEFALCESYANGGPAVMRSFLASEYAQLPMYRQHAVLLKSLAVNL